MWFPLMYHGVDTFVGALREKVMLANYAYQKMKEMIFVDVGPEPELTLFVFRFNGVGIYKEDRRHDSDIINSFNADMKQAFDEDGKIFLTTTMLDGRLWFRVCVLSVRTHQNHMDSLLDMVQSRYERRCMELKQ